MRSITWKLAGAFILVVLVSVGLTAFLISLNTASQFQQYISSCDSAYAEVVQQNLGQYYMKNSTWNNVQSFLQNQLKSRNQRLVLADNTGLIIGDTQNTWLGKRVADIGFNNPDHITSSGQIVGELYVVGCGNSGSGQMMDIYWTSVPALTIEEQNFLNTINLYLLVAGIIATVVALLLVLLFTRQITLPVRALTRGAHRIAEGDLNYRVSTHSKDELGELAQSFNRMASNLDKIEQSRKQLTADITHELRTPLTVIEGTVDAIMDKVFKPDNEHLGWIKEQTSLLTRLINDLRDLSLAESGQLKLNIVSVNIAELIERKVSQVMVKAQQKGVELTSKIEGSVPLLKLDPERIEQVIANLLSNAIRHTPDKGKISIVVKTVDKGDSTYSGKRGVLISVRDTGEGIPEEHLPHIFDRFYRVESSRSKETGETGLGLAIVKQMIEAHNGKIWAESIVGSGATIFLLLPVA